MTGTDTLGQHTRSEIDSQPVLWRRALRLAADGVAGLPRSGERVLLLGCGTSHYAGSAYALRREPAGHGISDALVASELPTRLRPYDRVVAISRSGTSSELLDAVRQARAQLPGTTVTALLGEQDTPLAALADTVVDLSFADERSLVQTRFPTTLLVMLIASLDPAHLRAAAALPDAAAAAATAALPATGIRQLVVLGHGWGTALAQEAALKVREASGTWAEAYPVGEYRHGPLATSAAGTLVWGLGRLPDDLVAAVAATGGSVEHGGGDPLVELVRLQRYAVALASANQRDADTPWFLSRSVVLGDAPAPT